MTNPSDNPTPTEPPAVPDEWLSAYVDGELSETERVAVEQRLALDPAARDMVESFQRMSSEFGGLSKPTAPAGLAAAVADRVAVAGARPSSDGRGAESRRERSVRRWVWAGLAVAASLLFVVFGDRPDGVDIVKETALAEPAAEVRDELSRLDDRAGGDISFGAEMEIAASDESGASGVRELDTLDGLELAMEAPASPPVLPPASVPVARTRSQPTPSFAPSSSPDAANEIAPPQAVVRLGLERDALTNNAFERVLNVNGIAFDTIEPPSGVTSQLAAAGIELQSLGRRADREAETSGGAAFADGLSTDRGIGGGGAGLGGGGAATRAPLIVSNSGRFVPQSDKAVELVLVDAEPLQLEQCLACFNDDTSNFNSVTIEPTETLERRQKAVADSFYGLQQDQVAPWQRYNRAGPVANAAPQRFSKSRSSGVKGEPAPGQANAFAGRAYRFTPQSGQLDIAEQSAPLSSLPAEGEQRSAAEPSIVSGRAAANRKGAEFAESLSNRVQVLFLLEADGAVRPLPAAEAE